MRLRRSYLINTINQVAFYLIDNRPEYYSINLIDKAKSGFGKGIDLGKAAIGGIASILTGIPGIGLLANAFGPMSPEDKAMRDFYGENFSN